MAPVTSIDQRLESPAPSLDSLFQLLRADLDRVNALIVSRMHSPVALIPQLAGHIVSAGGKRLRPMLTLASARLCGYRRIHVIFQPHRYTRTYHLMDEFARSFMQADRLYVLDIYAASEKPIEGVTAEVLVERIRGFGHRSAEYVGSMDRAVEAALAGVEAGDAVLTLGAGNVWQAGDQILDRVRKSANGKKTDSATRGRGYTEKAKPGRGDIKK